MRFPTKPPAGLRVLCLRYYAVCCPDLQSLKFDPSTFVSQAWAVEHCASHGTDSPMSFGIMAQSTKLC